MDIIRKVVLCLKYCVSSNYRQYRFIRKLEIFDSSYFQALNGAPGVERGDLLWQYIKTSKEFCKKYVHNSCQWEQFAEPHPLFDTAFYISSYFPRGIRQNPFFHYLKKGWKKGLWPGPFFSPQIYQKKSSWSPDQGDPLSHYALHGTRKNRSPGLFFDINWYLDKTPVLFKAKKDIIRHYKLFGSREGKSPVPVFDPQFYLSQLDDVTAAQFDPFSHFITHANKRSIQPNEWFDLDYYCSNESIKTSRVEAFSNYLSKGVFNRDYINQSIAQMDEKPIISVVVPVYKPNISFLNNCIRSVVYQVYPHWELCLADDDSPDQEIREVLLYWAEKDSRIKVIFRDENMGISAATNSAAALAKGDYLGFLDNDDELAPDCLLRVAETINDTSSQVIYTDEDLIGDDGTRLSVFYKPDFNRDLLFSHNYVTHFIVVAAELFKKLGGFSSDYDGAQDYDFMLKLSEQTKNITHIPQILYHWRASESSTSINHGQKSYAHQAGKRALENSLKRRNLSASVEDTDLKFYYRIKFPNHDEPSVSVIQWLEQGSKDHDSQLSLLKDKTQYDNSQFMSVSADQHRDKVNLLHNAVLHTETDYTAFIGSNIIDLESAWLIELLTPLQQNSHIGIVCGNIHYSNTDEASYTLPDLANRDCEYFANFLAMSSIHANGYHCTQLIHYGNWDFCLLRRSLFNQLGGFDFNLFPHILAMADFSLRAIEQGEEILYTPYAQAVAFRRKKTFPLADSTELEAEKERFQKKWKQRLDSFDPYYNLGILDENNIDRSHFRQWVLGEDK